MPDSIIITPTWSIFPAVDGIFNTFVKIVVKITSVDLPEVIEQTFADSETRNTGNDFSIIKGAHVHQEVTFYYQNLAGLQSYKPQVSDFTAGLAGYPRNLRVAFEGLCPLISSSVGVIVAGVGSPGDGVPTPNGSYSCRWNSTDFEWQAIVHLDEWAIDRAGFLIGTSCSGGLFYRHVNIYPSMEPIGGGTDIYNNAVILDSGGGGFGITGTATVTP